MNDIIRKPMSDVTVPHNDIVKRQSPVPQAYPPSLSKKGETDRIEGNPFFERARRKGDKAPSQGEKKEPPRYTSLLWAFFIVVVLAFGFFVSNYFSRATVTIEPTTKSASLDSDFVAGASGLGEQFAFKSVSLTEEQSEEVTATIEKKIQNRASGKVMIYNWYSGASQRLVINTRLESPERKIFRLEKSVEVPGGIVVDGKVTVPGQVEATVHADIPGEGYNIGVSNFTLPGLKGDPRYTKFRAASVADSPIRGGFSGTVMVPSEEAIATTLGELKEGLKKTTIEKIKAQIPESEVFFPGSMVIKFEEIPQDFTKNKTAKVVARATITVFFFDTNVLTRKIVETVSPDEKDKLFSISNLSSLAFTFVDPVDNVVFSDLSKIRFHLSGEINMVGQIDSEKIKTALAGKKKTDFPTLLKEQNNIYKADMAIRPLWKVVFPNDLEKITVKIDTDKVLTN